MAGIQRRASERFLAWFGQTLESNPDCMVAFLCTLKNNVNLGNNNNDNNNKSWLYGSGLISR